jgi:predicted ATPase
VFQVRGEGLRTEFPPLRALDLSPGNLRPAVTSLIGRESEVAEVQAAVKTHRLVTLTGVGGVGKTRLALEVAARLADEFPDGVWVFELAAVTDPSAVPEAVAAVLGITQQPGKSVSESVATALEGRFRLLVIDNCEHVLDAAADLIEAILARSATVRILATSREVLGVGAEQVRLVRSLDVSAGIQAAAVCLFVERAQGSTPGFSVVEGEEAAAVIEICQRLDGIPLAIELAASRMASMTAREMRDRLDHRFRLLVGSRRGLERHHTLRHAVGWSYDLLDDTEKSVLDQCSVSAGGFDLQSACAVAGSGDLDEFAIFDVLDALVRKSLLVADRSSGRTRFSMLETIRQFAEEQLVASDAAIAARDAHAGYFAGREADVLALWDGPRQRQAYAWFIVELANLRAAFRWAANHRDLDTAAAIAIYAAFLGSWVEQYEPAAWAEELIEPARAVDHRRLAQLYVMATQCYLAGRIDEALDYAKASRLTIASGRFDKVPYEFVAWAGGVYAAEGRPERWVDLCHNIIAREPGTHTFARACLVIALFVARSAEQAAASEGLLAAADATDNPQFCCVALMAYGSANADIDPVAAHEVTRRALRIAQESGNRAVETHLAVGLSRLAATSDEPIDALDYLTLAIRNYYDSGSFSLMSNALAVLVAFLDRLGRYEPAATISGFAVNPFASAAFPEVDPAISHPRSPRRPDLRIARRER